MTNSFVLVMHIECIHDRTRTAKAEHRVKEEHEI